MARRFFCTAALALVLGTAAAADSALDGEWVSEAAELRLKDGVLEIWFDDGPMSRGTYTVLGDTITIKVTHQHGGVLSNFVLSPLSPFAALDSRWYSQDEFRELAVTALAAVLLANVELSSTVELPSAVELPSTVDEMIAELGEIMGIDVVEMIDSMFVPIEANYSVNGNTLTLLFAGEQEEVLTGR